MNELNVDSYHCNTLIYVRGFIVIFCTTDGMLCMKAAVCCIAIAVFCTTGNCSTSSLNEISGPESSSSVGNGVSGFGHIGSITLGSVGVVGLVGVVGVTGITNPPPNHPPPPQPAG